MDIKLAEFRMELVCHWQDGQYEEFISEADMQSGGAAEDMEDEGADDN